MKRLLALMLAMLLPGAALCETLQTEIMLTVREQELSEIIAPVLSEMYDVTQEQAETLAQAFAGLMNNSGLRVTVQEDAQAFELLLGGKTLVDVQALVDSMGNTVFTSGLFKGYGLTRPAGEEQATVADAGIDWASVLTGVRQEAEKRISALPYVTTEGAFAGDAYTGGTSCRTYQLDDSDVAAFLQGLMTDDARDALALLFDIMGMDGKAALAALDDTHARVAAENAYAYLLRVVEDAEGSLVGLSLTVQQGTAQLATVSVGMASGEMKIVVGIGGAERNGWCAHSIRNVAGGLAGESVAFWADKEQAYPYAAAVTTEYVSEISWSLYTQPLPDGISWDFSADAQDGRAFRCVAWHHDSDGTFGGYLQYLVNDTEIALVNVEVEAVEPLQIATDQLTLCSLNTADEAQLALQEQIFGLAEQILSMRLLLILPMNVLTLFME